MERMLLQGLLLRQYRRILHCNNKKLDWNRLGSSGPLKEMTHGLRPTRACTARLRAAAIRPPARARAFSPCLLAAMAESRQRQADREIARFWRAPAANSPTKPSARSSAASCPARRPGERFQPNEFRRLKTMSTLSLRAPHVPNMSRVWRRHFGAWLAPLRLCSTILVEARAAVDRRAKALIRARSR